MFDSSAVACPGAAAAAELERVAPETLADADLIAYTQAAHRQVAHAEAVALRAVELLAARAEARAAAAPGPAEQAERERSTSEQAALVARAGIEEVRQALHLSAIGAGNRISLAYVLGRDPGRILARALAAGRVSLSHVRVAVEHTEGHPDALVEQMLTATLPRASRQTPGDFGKSLKRLAYRLDATGATERYRQVVTRRTGLEHRAGPDGTGTITLTAAEPETEWAFTVIDTLARVQLRRAGATGLLTTDDPADGVARTPSQGRSRPSLSRLRAQVLMGLLQRAVTDPSFPTQHGRRRVETQVVLTLETLLALRDDPATINGRPVPGPVARELASGMSTLRRLVTDPVCGHLLDYGPAYPAPQALTEFLLARDLECRRIGDLGDGPRPTDRHPATTPPRVDRAQPAAMARAARRGAGRRRRVGAAVLTSTARL